MRKLVTFLIFALAGAIVLFSQPSNSLPVTEEGKQALHIWGIYDLPEVYKPVIETFEKSHPNTEVIYRQFPNGEEYHQVLVQQLEKGRGPDIILFSSEHRDLYWQYINPTSGEHAEGFTSLVGDQLVENNLLYGLPLWVDSLMLYYNKKLYPDGPAPGWYDFAEQTRELRIGGIAMGRLDNLKAGWDILQALFLQKNIVLDGPAQNNLYDTVEFFARFAYPIDRYFNWNEKLSRNYPDQEVDSFVRKKVAAIAGYSSVQGLINLKSDRILEVGGFPIRREEVGLAPFPQFDLDNPAYLSKYYALSVSLHSHYPNEAWEFIRLLTNEEYAPYYQQATGRTPGRILPLADTDTEKNRIQKLQLKHAGTYTVSEEAKAQITPLVNRASKDKRVLRNILNLEF